MQARRTSIVPEDHTETFGNKQKDFKKALQQMQLLKESLHKSSSRCENNSNNSLYFEANFATKEEINGVKATPGDMPWRSV